MFTKYFLISLGVSLAVCRHIPFYRKDYVYINEFEAFYKLHSDSNGIAWTTAFFSCENEGSQLFYPRASEEWKIVKNLFESRGLSYDNFTDIYVGIKNEGIEEFMTIDGLSTPSPLSNNKNLDTENMCTAMNVENGSLKVDLCANMDSTTKPYVCKKIEDVTCPTIDHAYTYIRETRKCYKVNKISQTWHEALNTCVMEGGLLVNIESEMEAKILTKLVERDQVYHVGFRNIPPSQEYYTMKGQNVKDTYGKFYDSNSNTLECGAVRTYGENLYLVKIECNRVQGFVCEMDINA